MSLLSSHRNAERAKILQRFFKTDKGEYGEGDKFLGITVPVTRKIAKQNWQMDFLEIQNYLNSPWHEERLLALLILTYKYEKEEKQFEKTNFEKDKEKLKKVLEFYLKNTSKINNWDLVDSSAHKIVGKWALANPEDEIILDKLANSKNMWEQRIAIISTFALIKENKLQKPLELCHKLLEHKHDLMHKAVGWVLREIWKKDSKIVEDFLMKNYSKTPRTTLRYAIERIDENKRKQFLVGNF